MTDEMGLIPQTVGSLVQAMRPSPALPSRSANSTNATDSVNRRLIAERIAALLSHYWLPSDTPEVRSRAAGDWLADLEEFPASIVAEACQQWRRTQSRKPMPSDIRGLCTDYMPAKPSDRPQHD